MRWLTALWPGHRVVQSHLQLPRFMWLASFAATVVLVLIIWFDFAMRHGKAVVVVAVPVVVVVHVVSVIIIVNSPCCCCYCCCRLLMEMPKQTYPIAVSQACSAAKRNSHRPSSARRAMWRCYSTRTTLRIRWVSNSYIYLHIVTLCCLMWSSVTLVDRLSLVNLSTIALPIYLSIEKCWITLKSSVAIV